MAVGGAAEVVEGAAVTVEGAVEVLEGAAVAVEEEAVAGPEAVPHLHEGAVPDGAIVHGEVSLRPLQRAGVTVKVHQLDGLVVTTCGGQALVATSQDLFSLESSKGRKLRTIVNHPKKNS